MSQKQKSSKVNGLSTKMMRVVISGTRKKRGPLRRLSSSFAIVGAGLMVILYLGIPLLLLFSFLNDWILQIFGAALLLAISEFVVCLILLNIGKPGKRTIQPAVSARIISAVEQEQNRSDALRNARLKQRSVKSRSQVANVDAIQKVKPLIPMPGMPVTPNTSQPLGYPQPDLSIGYHDYIESIKLRMNEQRLMTPSTKLTNPSGNLANLSGKLFPPEQPAQTVKDKMPQS